MTEKSQEDIFMEWLKTEMNRGLKSLSYTVSSKFYELSDEEKLRNINEFNAASQNANPVIFNETSSPSPLLIENTPC